MTKALHTYQCISTQFKITFVNFGTWEANRAFFGTIFGHWSRSGPSPEIRTIAQALLTVSLTVKYPFFYWRLPLQIFCNRNCYLSTHLTDASSPIRKTGCFHSTNSAFNAESWFTQHWHFTFGNVLVTNESWICVFESKNYLRRKKIQEDKEEGRVWVDWRRHEIPQGIV